MPISKITFTFGVTQSANYQSARADLSVEYVLAEGEDAKEAFERVRASTVERVRETVSAEIEMLADAAQTNQPQQRGGRY